VKEQFFWKIAALQAARTVAKRGMPVLVVKTPYCLNIGVFGHYFSLPLGWSVYVVVTGETALRPPPLDKDEFIVFQSLSGKEH